MGRRAKNKSRAYRAKKSAAYVAGHDGNEINPVSKKRKRNTGSRQNKFVPKVILRKRSEIDQIIDN